MKITDEQINLILKGIENGFTIQECCKKVLHINSNRFYRNATKEQKQIVITHKLLHSDITSCYKRSYRNV